MYERKCSRANFLLIKHIFALELHLHLVPSSSVMPIYMNIHVKGHVKALQFPFSSLFDFRRVG